MGDSLGERIRARRQRKGWTLKELAERTGLSVPYLSDIERRSMTNPTLETLTSLADALDCGVIDLLGEATTEGPYVAALPGTLQRFVQTDEFQTVMKRLAAKTGRPRKQLQDELVNFLAMAPKRAKGELKVEDWRRLLDMYSVIMD